MGKWQNLTAKLKALVIRFAILNGVSDINSIRDTYNLYSNGDNLTHKKSGKKLGESQGLNSSWLPDFDYNPDNGRRPLQSILQDAAIQRTIQQKALQRQAEMEAEREAQRKATHEIYNGMPNPGAGYVSGTDPLLQAIVDMTPAGDAEMATEAASELRNGNLKEAGILGAALLLPNIFNKGIKKWRAVKSLKNSEHGLTYTTRQNIAKYNPSLDEETIQALQQAERDYNNGLFALEHQSELEPIFELGLHTPAGIKAYPNGVEIWYRGLNRSKGKQVGLTPEEFEAIWDKSIAAGKYDNLFFGDLETASSYISGHTNPLEYSRIAGRSFPKGDSSKLLQLVFPKGKSLEINTEGRGWADLNDLPFGKLSTKEETQLKRASIIYTNELKNQRLLQQRLDNYYRRHPEKLQEVTQTKWLQELQDRIYESYGKVSKARRDLTPLYKKKYPFSRTEDVSKYLTDSPLDSITLLNIQDNGPKITAWGQLGNVSIKKPVPGNYGKSAIASDFKFDLNDPSIWAFGGNLNSTGGPLYPFSFEKNPFLKTPVVRYKDGGLTYTVKSGDTLSGIAKSYGVSILDLLNINEGLNPDVIKVGLVINLVSNNKTPTKKQIIDMAWANENPFNEGLKKGLWYPYDDPNGKGKDVGPGLLIGSAIPAKSSYTKKELDEAAYLYGLESLAAIGEEFNNKYGTKEFLTPFDTVSVAPKLLLMDTRYLNGNIPIENWPSLYNAVATGNWSKALLESRSTYTDKNGKKHYDNDRVRRRAETMFPGMFDVSYKEDSKEKPVVTSKKKK